MNRGKQILTVCVVVFAMTVCVWTSPMSGGTVAHWKFEEGPADTVATGDGSVLDSANGLNGTPIGGPVYRSAATPGGSLGLEFDGSNDRVFVPDDPAFALTGSVTLEAFISVDPFVPKGWWDNRQIVMYGDDRGQLDPYYLSVQDADKRLVFHIEDESRNMARLLSPDPVPTDQMIHVAGTLDAATGEQKLYINGVVVASAVTGIRPFGALDPGRIPGIGIGNLQSDSWQCYFEGIIADVRISDVALTPDQFISESATFLIDIKPGSLPNSINLKSRGVLPVAVLGSEDLDVSLIDPDTLTLEGVAPRVSGKSGHFWSLEDVNGDSILDLMLHFDLQGLTIDPESTELTLEGLLTDGTAFEGSDSIRIVPPMGGEVIPEPATLALLILGGLAVVRKR